MFLIRTSLRSPRSLNAVSVIQNFGMSSKDSIINDDFQEYSVISEAPDDNNLSPLASKRQKMENTFNKRDEFWAKYPQYNPAKAREAWVEDLTVTQDDGSNEIIRLHPDVWSVRPRLDIIYQNVEWQKWYKKVDYEYVKDRYEIEYSSNRRPWPQKGGGKARHATTIAPQWHDGAKAHGNKGPRTYFHMKPYSTRVLGLIHTLSAKFAQDDVRIVRDLEIPSDDPKYIERLIDQRGWALSTLFVDKSDEFPQNITAATMPILHVNLMPAYSLNVHDMLKHKTLVLTKSAVEYIEEKILFAQRRIDQVEKCRSAGTSTDTEMPFYNKFGSLS